MDWKVIPAAAAMLVAAALAATAAEPTVTLAAPDWSKGAESGLIVYTCQTPRCGKGNIVVLDEFQHIYNLEEIIRLGTGSKGIAQELANYIAERFITKTKLLGYQPIVAPGYAGFRFAMTGKARSGEAFVSGVIVGHGHDYRSVTAGGGNQATADSNLNQALRGINWRF